MQESLRVLNPVGRSALGKRGKERKRFGRQLERKWIVYAQCGVADNTRKPRNDIWCILAYAKLRVQYPPQWFSGHGVMVLSTRSQVRFPTVAAPL